MSRDYLLYLEDMQVSCKKLLRYAEGLDFDQFVADESCFGISCKRRFDKSLSRLIR